MPRVVSSRDAEVKAAGRSERRRPGPGVMKAAVSDEPLQFDKAEFSAGGSVTTCAACQTRISGTYWEANGHLVCTECRDKLVNRKESPDVLGKAFVYALGVAAAGSIAWALL